MALVPENISFRVSATLWRGPRNYVEFGGEGQDAGTLGIGSRLLARNWFIVEAGSRFKAFALSGIARQRFENT